MFKLVTLANELKQEESEKGKTRRQKRVLTTTTR